MKDKLRREMQVRQELNPFHWHYDPTKLERLVLDCDQTNETLTLDTLLEVCNVFNDYYYQLDEHLKALLRGAKSINRTGLEALFSVFNRNFIVSQTAVENPKKGFGSVTMQDINAWSVQSQDPSIGSVFLQNALETDIDALNVVCNIYRHQVQSRVTPIELDEGLFVPVMMNIYAQASFNYILKEMYEDAVWNGGDFEFNRDARAITIKYFNTDELKAQKIGHYRIQLNSMQHYFFFLNQVGSKTRIGESYSAYFLSTRTDKKLKKALVSNGVIKPTIAKRLSLNTIDRELRIQGELVAYYPFLDIFNVTAIGGGLTLVQVLTVFASIQELIEKAVQDSPYGQFKSLEDVNRYPVRMGHAELVEYLMMRLKYNVKTIRAALSIISSAVTDRIDLWASPILKSNKDYLFGLMPITVPITLKLIDGWLERLGFDLARRGKLFEQYVREQILEMMSRKSWSCYVEPRSKLTGHSKAEEIDLIVVMKNVVIVAELKCTPYSTTPREHYNARKIITKAVDQVKRKTQFLMSEDFADDSLRQKIGDKQILQLVITNFPMFTGSSVNGVPVVDFYLLEGYLRGGSMSSGYYKQDKGVMNNHTTSTTYYYRSEVEMNDSLSDFVTNPPPVRKLEEEHHLITSKFTPQGAHVDIYCEHYSPKPGAGVPVDLNRLA